MRLVRRLLPTLAVPVALALSLGAVPSAGAVLPSGPTSASTADDTQVVEGEAVRTSIPLVASSEPPAQLSPHETHAHSIPGEAEDEGDLHAPDGPAQTARVSLQDGVTVLGMRWSGDGPARPALRVRPADGSWSPWRAMPTVGAAAEGAEGEALGTEGDVVVGPAEVEVQLTGEVEGAVLEAWTTSQTAQDAQTVAALPQGGRQLVVGTRGDWGADEDLRATRPSNLVHDFPALGTTIHHTADWNGYTESQVPAMLRSIFQYHAQTLGWGDVGYAMLVDRFGRAWEGRAGGIENNIQLAHALGMNRDWNGISVIGNFEGAAVPEPVMTTLARLTAFSLDTHGVSVRDQIRYRNEYFGWTRTMPAVHGHRDVMSTLCPGGGLYVRMAELRDRIAAAQAGSGATATQRVGGATRYDVSAQMAREAFLEGTRTAYLASGAQLSDALGVGPVADARGAAVLLTRPDGVPAQTLSALTALGVREVVLVGGTGAIQPAVADALSARGLTVSRVTGANRYATAAALATQRPRTGGTVYVAEGVGLADALGAAAAAAEQGGVVLLTRPGALPAVTATALGALAPSRVVVLGGEGAVSEAVRAEIAALLPRAAVERIGGRNRYATSGLLAVDAFDSATSAVVASGTAPADAMVGTQLAARHDSPVLLTRTGCRPSDVDVAYRALGTTLSRLAGGTGVLQWSAGDTVC